MNSEREKADILFDYGLPLQFGCHLIQFYTLLFLRVATLRRNGKYLSQFYCITVIKILKSLHIFEGGGVAYYTHLCLLPCTLYLMLYI